MATPALGTQDVRLHIVGLGHTHKYQPLVWPKVDTWTFSKQKEIISELFMHLLWNFSKR